MDYHTAEQRLRESGIRVTRPRLQVYDYILRYRSHPTCEEIHRGLKDESPSLSLATVYNVTEKLCDEHLLNRLTSPNGERRFDGTLEFHGHFFCTGCGAIRDFSCDGAAAAQKLSGCKLNELEVKATGLCPDCLVK